MLQAIKLTFGSVWGWLGIIVGAISLINIGVMYFDVGAGPVLESVIETYRSIVHVGFDYLFFWIDLRIPGWVKDAAAIYCVLGAANLRTVMTTYSDRADVRARMRKNNLPTTPYFYPLWSFIFWWFYIARAVRQLTRWHSREFRENRIQQRYERRDPSESEWSDSARMGFIEREYDSSARASRSEVALILLNILLVPMVAFMFVTLQSGS